MHDLPRRALKSKEALEPILENFDGEESVQVRARMVNALGNIGGEKAKAKLRSGRKRLTNSAWAANSLFAIRQLNLRF